MIIDLKRSIDLRWLFGPVLSQAPKFPKHDVFAKGPALHILTWSYVTAYLISGRQRRARRCPWPSRCQGDGQDLILSISFKNLILSISFKKSNPFNFISTSNKPPHQNHDQVEELEHVLRRSATTRLKEETKISFLREQLGSQVRFWMVIMESERGGPFHFVRKWKCFSGCFLAYKVKVVGLSPW